MTKESTLAVLADDVEDVRMCAKVVLNCGVWRYPDRWVQRLCVNCVLARYTFTQLVDCYHRLYFGLDKVF